MAKARVTFRNSANAQKKISGDDYEPDGRTDSLMMLSCSSGHENVSCEFTQNLLLYLYFVVMVLLPYDKV